MSKQNLSRYAHAMSTDVSALSKNLFLVKMCLNDFENILDLENGICNLSISADYQLNYQSGFSAALEMNIDTNISNISLLYQDESEAMIQFEVAFNNSTPYLSGCLLSFSLIKNGNIYSTAYCEYDDFFYFNSSGFGYFPFSGKYNSMRDQFSSRFQNRFIEHINKFEMTF
jgi:hypothetical protein